MNKREFEKIPLEFDTPVPFYDLGVSCGLPSELGDIPPEIKLTRGQSLCETFVRFAPR